MPLSFCPTLDGGAAGAGVAAGGGDGGAASGLLSAEARPPSAHSTASANPPLLVGTVPPLGNGGSGAIVLPNRSLLHLVPARGSVLPNAITGAPMFGRSITVAALAIVALSFGCVADLDVTRDPIQRGSFGETIYREGCQR